MGDGSTDFVFEHQQHGKVSVMLLELLDIGWIMEFTCSCGTWYRKSAECPSELLGDGGTR
jgi:hypothetical protein